MNIFLKLALLGYVISTAIYLAHLIRPLSILPKIAIGTLLAGFVLHSAGIVSLYIEIGHIPVTTLAESLSFFGWTLVGIYLLSQLRYSFPLLGAFISPLAVLFLLITMAIPQKDVLLPPQLRSLWFPIHISFAFLGDAFFGIMFFLGIAYIIQERQVKHKTLGAIFNRLPSLEVLDDMSYRCLVLGLLLLTLGIISGVIWAQYAWGSYWNWDPKETFSLVTWLIYIALLHARLTVGWRGRKAAILSIIGFVVLLFTFIGVNLLLPSLHKFI